MVKTIFVTSALAAVVSVGLMASNAMALPTTLADILVGYSNAGNYTDTTAESGYLTDTDSNNDDSTSYLFVESNGLTQGSTFGIYSFEVNADGSVTASNYLEIFAAGDDPLSSAVLKFDLANGTVKNVNTNVTSDIGPVFAWYMTTDNDTYYSHSYLNSDGLDHAMVFDTSAATINLPNGGILGSSIVIAFETDDPTSGDFKDIVIGMTDVAPVPEPGVTLLFGLGVAGFAGVIRRRKTIVA